MRIIECTEATLGNAVRLNITIPEDVAEILKEMAGPREQSAFISRSVRFYSRRIKRKQLEAELREGYAATAEEGFKVSKEFDGTLMDGLEDENF